MAWKVFQGVPFGTSNVPVRNAPQRGMPRPAHMKRPYPFSSFDQNEGETKLVDLEAAAARWSPFTFRNQREKNGEMKVDSTNPLRGGQFISNNIGAAATLSFCFQDRDGKWYGLSTAHLVKVVGEEVFAFTGEQTSDGTHCAKVIGNVFDISVKTDSMVFEVKQARPHYATHPCHAAWKRTNASSACALRPPALARCAAAFFRT